MTTQPARYRRPAKPVPDDGNEPEASKNPGSSSTPASNKDTHVGVSVLDVVRVFLGILLLSSALSYFITGDSILWGWRPWWVRPEVVRQKLAGPISLIETELAKYDGTDPALPIYIALNGSIYDVSAAPNTYGPGGSYHVFAGRDAARAFLTGCFQQDQTADLRGVELMYIPRDDPAADAQLPKGQLKMRRERDVRVAKRKVKETIEHWAGVFRGDTGRPYFWVGNVKREAGWPRGPPPPLCEQAEMGRPTRKDAEAVERAQEYPA